MKSVFFSVFGVVLLASCANDPVTTARNDRQGLDSTYPHLAEEVRQETLRSWKAYKQYAWGHDVLMRNSKA
mgnify:FL=1